MSWLSVGVLITIHAGALLLKINHKTGQKATAAQVLRKAGLRLVLAAGFVSALATPAMPYEIPTTPAGSWTGSGVTTGTFTFGGATLGAETGSYFKTTPSGLRMTITVNGTFPPGSGSYFFTTPSNTNTTGLNPTAAGTSPGAFTTTPVMPIGANPMWMLESVFTCKTNFPAATSCPGIGNVTVTFTDPLGGLVPVVQPKIHVTRLGGTVGAMELGAGMLNNTSGIAATAAATVTLSVKNGNEFYGNPTPAGSTLNIECGVTATTTAGCGTVQVTGTNSSLNFTVNAYRTTAGANAWGDGADGFFFDMSFDEDFGSAPTTYEGGGIAAANLLTDLRLGAGVSAENTLTAADANGGATGTGMLTVSPLAAAAGAIPGDTNDGVTFPLLTTSMVGTTYTVTPTMSGASRAGVTCGWIDFDANGTFTPATEGVCAPFAAGATSVPLNFTVPAAGVSAGPTYARFRTTYDTAMTTSSFNGLFSSGETEDYQIHIKPLVQVVKTLAPTSDTGTFNLLINGTSFASAVGNAGTTGFKTVYHTDTPDVTVATNIRNAAIAGVALTETAAGASVLTDYVTTSACVDANSTAVVTGGTAAAPTVTIPQSAAGNAKAQTITCTLTNTRLPKVRVQKSTIGGFGGPFTFAQTNLASAPTAITTIAAATPTPAAPAAINVTTIGAAVTITETPAAGYTLTGGSCTDANSAVTGNSGAIGSFAGNVLTILGANVKAGADFTCLFTNTRAVVKVQKTTTGGFGGPFSFAQTNLLTTPAAITTIAIATATPAAPTANAVTTIGNAVTITETPLTGYVLATATCTDANSGVTGNLGTFGTLAGNVLTIASGNVKSGADITCNFTNAKIPTVKIQKTTLGNFGGPFTFAQTNLASAPAGITTVAVNTATPAAPAAINITTVGTAVTLTETPLTGYALTAAVCTDANSANTGNTGSIGTLAGNVLTILGANTVVGSDFTCVFTNTKLPTLQLTKISNGGVGGFTFTGSNGWTSQTITTVTSGTGVAGAVQTLTTAGVSTTITEAVPAGYVLAAPTCTGTGAGTATFSGGVLTLDALATAAGNTVACTFTNTKTPTMKVQKTTIGGFGGPFNFAQTNLASAPAGITTIAASTATPAAPTAINVTTIGAAITLTETPLTGYALTAASCTDANSGITGNSGSFGTLAGNVLTVPLGNVKAGADFTCGFTNTKLPTLQISKTSIGAVGGFTFTGTNGWTSQTITTVTSGTAVTGAIQTLTTASTATTLTEAIPAGYAMTAASCSGLGAGTATPNLAAGTIALDAAATAAGNVVSCSVTNTKLPTLQINKTSLGGVGGFTFTGNNGWTSQTITTVTAGTAVTGAVQTLTAASTATTLTEALPAGYAMTAASCSGLGAGTATPNLAAATIALDAAATAAGNVVSCSVTNSKLPSLTLVKTITNDNGGAATLATFPLTATGPTTITGVSGMAAVTSQLVGVGTYALSETISPTYTAGAWSCTAGTLTGSSLVLAAGQVSTCTINNNDIAPVLTLVKTVTNDNGGASAVAAFTLTATGPTTITGITGAAAVTAAPVSVGTYALSEAGPAGYAAGAWSCTAGTLTGSSLVLALGQTATCTINNNDIAPTLTLRKTTSGGVNTFSFSGTNGFGSDSITTLVAGTPVSGATKTLTLGNTATDITETVTSGYFLNGAPTCSGMGTGGTVTLVSGTTYRLNVAATANASNIICSFANTLAAPQLAVAKSASVASVNAAGNTITYTIAVSNPGNVTVTAIIVTDPLGTVICAVSGNATIGSLAPAASQNCTITYVVPQIVIDNNGGGDGKIDNTATVTGSYGASVITASGSAAVNIIRNPLLTIVKTANTAAPQPAGAVITYTYQVTNSGNVTMSGVAVTDAHNGTGTLVGPTNEVLTTDTSPAGDSTDAANNAIWDTLAPGDVVTFTATYTVTQNDVDTLQ